MSNHPVLEDTTVLIQELLEASKAAERLISVLFEMGVLEDEPFLGIWRNLEKAIDKAQAALNQNQSERT